MARLSHWLLVRNLALTGVLLLSACASFSETQKGFIAPALEMQSGVASDPKFRQVLVELEGRGAIVWDHRLSPQAKEESDTIGSKIEWLLAKYQASPGLPEANVRPWWKWNPISSTTADYDPNTNIVRLNLWRFNKDEFALLNTFFHEHGHSFGLKHHPNQKRPTNMCDPTYISGDLGSGPINPAVEV